MAPEGAVFGFFKAKQADCASQAGKVRYLKHSDLQRSEPNSGGPGLDLQTPRMQQRLGVAAGLRQAFKHQATRRLVGR